MSLIRAISDSDHLGSLAVLQWTERYEEFFQMEDSLKILRKRTNYQNFIHLISLQSKFGFSKDLY